MRLAKHLGTGKAIYAMSDFLPTWSLIPVLLIYLPCYANTDNNDLIDEEMDSMNQKIKRRLGPSQVLTDLHLWLSDLDAEIGTLDYRRAHELLLPSFQNIQDLRYSLSIKLNLKDSFQFIKAGYPPAECRGGRKKERAIKKVYLSPN